MPGRRDPPTPSEWQVLKIVWDAGSCAARDVVARLSDSSDWSVSTVKTLLRRLVDKGHLKTRRVGNSFLYEPRSPRKTLEHAADSLLGIAKRGTVGPLLAYMVERSDLSDEELAKLRDLLDRHEQKRPKGKS